MTKEKFKELEEEKVISDRGYIIKNVINVTFES